MLSNILQNRVWKNGRWHRLTEQGRIEAEEVCTEAQHLTPPMHDRQLQFESDAINKDPTPSTRSCDAINKELRFIQGSTSRQGGRRDACSQRASRSSFSRSSSSCSPASSSSSSFAGKRSGDRKDMLAALRRCGNPEQLCTGKTLEHLRIYLWRCIFQFYIGS